MNSLAADAMDQMFQRPAREPSITLDNSIRQRFKTRCHAALLRILHRRLCEECRLPSEPSPDREKMLGCFPLLPLLRYNQEGMGALTLKDFIRLCEQFRLFHSKTELNETPRDELVAQLTQFFMRLDVGGDGILSADDTDGYGFVTQRVKRLQECEVSTSQPYGFPRNRHLKLQNGYYEGHLAAKQGEIERNGSHRRCSNFCVYEYSIPVLYLPPALAGTKILHISDIHFHGNGRDKAKNDFLQGLPSCLGCKPDFVFFTGDLIDKSASGVSAESSAIMQRLFPSARRAFVLGNHDYYDSAAVRRIMEGAGFENLTNRHKVFEIGGKPLNVIGADDWHGGKPQFPQLSGEKRLEPHILLTHNLDALNNTAPGVFDLVLSGHTHSGEWDLGVLSGLSILRIKGEFNNLNHQVSQIKCLSRRTVSHISPGLERHPANLLGMTVPCKGVSLLTLANAASAQ